MATHAYCRVSTLDQHTENQEILINSSPFKVDHWYLESGVSGKVPFGQRAQGKNLLTTIESGDYVIFAKIDRIGRKMVDNLNVVQDFLAKNITIIILNMGQIDNTPTGKLILNIFCAFAEFEREQMLERQRDGFARAKQQGKKFGAHSPQIRSSLLKNAQNIKINNLNNFNKIINIIDEERLNGKSWKTISDHLNSIQLMKLDGSDWSPSSLRRQYIRFVNCDFQMLNSEF